MKTMLLVLFSVVSFAAPLTVSDLDGVRQRAAQAMLMTALKAQANTSAQAANAWIEANRGSLPNDVTVANLTAPQRVAVQAAMGVALTAPEKIAVFNAVGILHQIVPPPLPDPLQAAADAARVAFLSNLSAAIDAAQPGLTAAEKRAALRLMLSRL